MGRKRMVRRWTFLYYDQTYQAGRDKTGLLWVMYGVMGWRVPKTPLMVREALAREHPTQDHDPQKDQKGD